MNWVKTIARGYNKHLIVGIWCDLYQRFYDTLYSMYKTPQNHSLNTAAIRNINSNEVISIVMILKVCGLKNKNK